MCTAEAETSKNVYSMVETSATESATATHVFRFSWTVLVRVPYAP